MIELNDMIELSDKYWLTQNDDKQKENINQLIKIITKATLNDDTLIYQPARLIYQPARQQHRMFCYDILNYYYRNVILSLKNGATLDDLKLSTKYWTWYFNSTRMPIKFLISITFKEFMNNRSLSRYIQKASKEINYEISNRNRNNNRK